MYNIHEIEERDYNPATDAENAFALSRAMFEPRDPRINEALAAGKYAVIAHVLAYCPFTDACLGERLVLEIALDTREEAEAFLTYDEDEVWFSISGPTEPEPTAEPAPTITDDEIPF